jgi:hypothetical protein
MIGHDEDHCLPGKKEGSSALLFTGKCRQSVRAGLYLAPFCAGFALGKFRCCDQCTAPGAGIAAGILPAPVSQLVEGGTDLRSIHTACEVSAVAGAEPAGGSTGSDTRICWWNCRKDRRGRCRCAARKYRGATGGKQHPDKHDRTYAVQEELVFHTTITCV